MALMTCPECGKQVSDKAPTCPSCAFPIAAFAGPVYAAQPAVQAATIPPKGIVSVVLGTCGLLVAATIYGIMAAPIFLIPALILGHAAHVQLRRRNGRSSTLLVVFATLEWIAVILGAFAWLGLLIAWIIAPENL